MPPGLNAAGKRAWKQAMAVLDEQAAPAERFIEAAVRYARAVDFADRVQRQHKQEGYPTLAQGGATGSAVVPHPLVRIVAEAERDAARFGAALGLDPQSRKKLGAAKGRPQERVPSRRKGEPAKVVALHRTG